MSTPNHPTGRGRSTAGSSSQRNAQLPAFCRSRSSRTQLVSVSNLRNLQRLMLLVLSLLPGWPHSLLGSTDPHPLQQQRVLP